MISSSSHAATVPLNSTTSSSSSDRSLAGAVNGGNGLANTGPVAGGGNGNATGGAPFVYNPSRGHPNFNPSKPVVVINRALETNSRAKGKGENAKTTKNRKKQLNSKEDTGKGAVSNNSSANSSTYNDYHGHGSYGYYGPDDSEMEESENAVSLQKQVSSSRFLRNNMLIAEVFSDKVMPDQRSVVTHSRLEVLRRQAESLISHQEKQLGELALIEEKFKEKKRRMMESSNEFNQQLEKLSKPVPNAEMFQKMVDNALQQIKQHHEDQKNKPQKEIAPPSPPSSQGQEIAPSTSASSQSASQQSQGQSQSSQVQYPISQYASPSNNTSAFSQASGGRVGPTSSHSQCNNTYNQNSNGSMNSHAYGDANYVPPGVVANNASGNKPNGMGQHYGNSNNHSTSFNYSNASHSTQLSTTNQHSQPATPHGHSHPQHQYSTPNGAPIHSQLPNHHSSGYQWPSYQQSGPTTGGQGLNASYHPSAGMLPSQQGPHQANGTMAKPRPPPPGQVDMNYNLRNALSAPGAGSLHAMAPNASSVATTYPAHNSSTSNSIASMSPLYGHQPRPSHASFYPHQNHNHLNRPPPATMAQHTGSQMHHQPISHTATYNYPLMAASKTHMYPALDSNAPSASTSANASISVNNNTGSPTKKTKNDNNNQSVASGLANKKGKKPKSTSDTCELNKEGNTKGLKKGNNKRSDCKKDQSGSKKKSAVNKERTKQPSKSEKAAAVEGEEDKKSDVTEVDTDNETIMSGIDDDRTMLDDESFAGSEASVSGAIIPADKQSSASKQSNATEESTKKTKKVNSKESISSLASGKGNNNKRKSEEIDEELDEDDIDDDDDEGDLEDEDYEEELDEEDEGDDDEDEDEDDSDSEDDDQEMSKSRKRSNSCTRPGTRKRPNSSESRSSKSGQRNLRNRKG